VKRDHKHPPPDLRSGVSNRASISCSSSGNRR
jgi:hypothetical protein